MNQVEIYLQKLHNELLVIMDEVHRICTKYEFHYVLEGGSLLGAVRHKGFIPWDDDMDIRLERTEFHKLMAILPQELDNRFFLRWFNTDPKYTYPFAKVCMKDTLFLENNNDIGETIFIDIFPMDVMSNSQIMISIKSKIYRNLSMALMSKRTGRQWNFKSLIRNIISLTLCSVFIYALSCRIIGNPGVSNEKYMVFLQSVYPIKKVTFSLGWFGEGKLAQFEDRFYRIPNDSDSVLRKNFGTNYMELPPLSKQKMHYPTLVRFSDGSVIKFEEWKNKIPYAQVLDN